MMELLFGLGIATVVVVFWFSGNAFASTFLTLCALVVAGVGVIVAHDSGTRGGGLLIVVAAVALIALAWAPCIMKHRRKQEALRRLCPDLYR